MMTLFASSLMGQEIEHIHVAKKKNTKLYAGSQQEVADWFIYIDENKKWYLANLTLPKNEVNDWFIKRKNSNNIFKGVLENGMYPTLRFSKENEVNVVLNFYVKFEKNDRIILTSVDDGNNYLFDKQ